VKPERLIPLLVLMVALASPALPSASFVIVVADAAGTGLNDPTPVVAVGGNTATTLGAQRLAVLMRALEI
jgi:hypothetical protein